MKIAQLIVGKINNEATCAVFGSYFILFYSYRMRCKCLNEFMRKVIFWAREGKGRRISATPSPPQNTARLGSLADFFLLFPPINQLVRLLPLGFSTILCVMFRFIYGKSPIF